MLLEYNFAVLKTEIATGGKQQYYLFWGFCWDNRRSNEIPQINEKYS